jgi:hypothetical protein
VKLIRAGASKDLNLAIAAAEFGIDGRKDHAELTNHVGVDLRRCADAVGIAAVLNTQAVADRVHHARADACKRRGLAKCGATNTGHGLHEVENVVAHQRQVLNFFLRQNLADGRRSLGNQRRRLCRYLDGISHRADLQREVVSSARALSKLNFVDNLRFETGKFRG